MVTRPALVSVDNSEGAQMRKLHLLAVAAVFAFPAAGAAQATANMTVTASVTAVLTLTKLTTGDLSFGTVTAGTTPAAIAATSGIQFEAAGASNTQITVTYSTASISNGTHSLTFTPNVVANSTNSTTGTAAVASGGNVTLNGTGNYWFWVGGNIGSVPSTHSAGTYSGTWTLQVAY